MLAYSRCLLPVVVRASSKSHAMEAPRSQPLIRTLLRQALMRIIARAQGGLMHRMGRRAVSRSSPMEVRRAHSMGTGTVTGAGMGTETGMGRRLTRSDIVRLPQHHKGRKTGTPGRERCRRGRGVRMAWRFMIGRRWGSRTRMGMVEGGRKAAFGA